MYPSEATRSYARREDVEWGFRELDESEVDLCLCALEEAALIVDSYNPSAEEEMKKLVCCRMVRRLLGDGTSTALAPMGATQGSASALGYTQSWTIGGGSSGVMYLSRLEKKLLGVGGKIGSGSALEGLCNERH